jgi:Flp pilus assembly protein TadB
VGGGHPAEPLDRAAAALRARAADRAERRTHSAQARASALVMTWLPIVVLALLVAMSGAVRSVVVTPFGAWSVLAGAGLNLTGWRWMRRLVDGVRR